MNILINCMNDLKNGSANTAYFAIRDYIRRPLPPARGASACGARAGGGPGGRQRWLRGDETERRAEGHRLKREKWGGMVTAQPML